MSGEAPHALESNPSTQIPLAPPPGIEGTWAVSLAEIDAMGRKAARGAGLPWGLAEEAGRAARHLAAWGLPGPEALAALVAAAALPAGPAAGDWAWAGSGRLGGLAIRRVAGSAHAPRHADAGARPVALATWRALDRYAHRTYAPATEASRAGAGAGLTDSD